jgi:hypothetical protein|tara:strand:+ start:14671 stop:15492 length:822 start_codon:yes stop_codon:yes gene_type:complete
MPDRDGIQHVLLTRINVSSGFGHSDSRAITPAWLDRQLALFEGLALPAVRSQTTQDFIWILFASNETPDRYRERMESYAADERTFVHFVGEWSEEFPADAIAEHLDPSARHLLTSRIDTDDVISRDYLELVRTEAAGRPHCFLNWDDGYLFDLGKGSLYSYRHPSNMFINLVEPIKEGSLPATVMGGLHTKAAESAPIHTVRTEGKWIQVIHDQNWMSGFGGHPRPASKRVLARFAAPMLEAAPQRSIKEEVLGQASWAWTRLRGRVRRALTK